MTVGLSRFGLKAGAAMLVLGLAAGTGLVAAQNTSGDAPPSRQGRGRGPGGPDGPGIGGPMGVLGLIPMIASQLELTDTQKGQIKSIAQSHADEWKAVRDREQLARQALTASIDAAQFDELVIRQHSAELAAVEADAAVARARARGELISLLTPAQQTKLKELEARMMGRGDGPGRRGRRP